MLRVLNSHENRPPLKLMRLKDFQVGLTIKHNNMVGIIQFISDTYITFCISEKPVVCNNSKYKTTKCCVLIYPNEWKNCVLIDTNTA